MFKKRLGIKKQFNTIHNFRFKNLIVSGCSFTYNNHESSAATWPYYLRDLGGFEQVLDCSLPGAGNFHISNALQWCIENDQPDPKESFVIVMWSGNDRDDYVCPDSNNSGTYPFTFKYGDSVISGITGGSGEDNSGNTITGLENIADTKTSASRAIENYLYINGLKNYLENNGYQYVFLDYIDRSLPSRTVDFDIRKHLPKNLAIQMDKMFTKIMTPNEFALRNDLLDGDDFHPTPDGHLEWIKQVLLPKLQTIIN